ncbi:hypothetical protein [Enterovibrio norvegicus]|uniref:Uncharacterized protein n=1 Tax=Enterovibrio norvegicus TaxID=188144 RepID=A0A2N7LA08_9GAMM|nr:hypothetical protein [Enterovibrio norvegicus]PMN91374.1 hypothetical protein BCT23_17865 [Enterovibrio norvegicus]
MSTRPQLDITGTSLAITAAVVQALATFKGDAPDEVGSINRHKGRFATPDAVKHEVTHYGALRVAALNVSQVRREAGSLVGMVSLVAFVMTTDHYGHHRDERAEVISSKLAVFISGQDWSQALGRTAYKQPERVSAQNLCTEALDNIGVAIWSVSWQQECRLNVPIDLTTLDDFLTMQLDTPAQDNPALSATFTMRQDTTPSPEDTQ